MATIFEPVPDLSPFRNSNDFSLWGPGALNKQIDTNEFQKRLEAIQDDVDIYSGIWNLSTVFRWRIKLLPTKLWGSDIDSEPPQVLEPYSTAAQKGRHRIPLTRRFISKITDRSSSANETCTYPRRHPPCGPCMGLKVIYGKTTLGEILDSLRQSSCLFCQILFDIHCAYNEGWDADIKIRIFAPMAKGSTLHVLYQHPRSREQTRIAPFVLDVFVLPGTPSPAESIISMPQISGDTSSAQTCALARYWVHSCVERHPNCSKNIKVRLPSRVVLIEYDAIERAYGTRLVETSRAVGRYCCLSHRWGKPGGSPMPQTTQENYAQHLERIPFRSLTETFIDAIIMAHRLGLKFIWIDSLCIIQGNRDDWAVESKRMGSYYSNAYVTISASWGDDPEDGCFSLAAQEYMARKVEIRDHGKEYSIYTRRTLDHGYYWPLLRRGWVFQERLLSPRIIHFGQEELVWECLSETTCECGQSDTLQAQLSNKVDYSHILHDNFDLKAFRNLWRHLVEQYTTLELTYISDRFPAIAGLAAEMGRRRPSRYMYGLWEDSLIGDMLWTNWKGSGDHLPPRPLDMEAPTWSWASICDFIKYNKLGVQITPSLKERPYESVEETYADILSPLYSPGTQRSCGAELDPPACIVLRGPVIRASVCHGPMHHPPNPEYYKTSESAILKRLQESYEEKKHELKSELTLQGDDPRDTFKRYYFVPDYGLFHKGQYFVDPDSELLVVIMASVVYHAENSKQNRTDKSVLGIVVRSVYGEMGKYERVGFFHHDGDDCKVKVFERVEEKMVIKLI